MLKSLINEVFKKDDEKASGESQEFFGSERIRITILGTGGAGNNTVNRLCRIGISGVDLVACNTDMQDLKKIDDKIQKVLIGEKLTHGLGAGGFPDIGEKAAEMSKEKIAKALEGTHLLFLTAGMGGGTGTGSAPVIAQIAHDLGAIVVAVVTFPFKLERARLEKARQGIDNLRKVSDTVIIIDNNKLVEYVPNLPIDKAFMVADEVIARAVKGISDTILEPSLINLDFADIKAVMSHGKIAMMSIGDGQGPNRVEMAVKNTLSQPLLDVDYTGAKGALIHVTGGESMTIGEATMVGKLLTKDMSHDANVTFGARVDPKLKDKLEVFGIFTGVRSPNILGREEILAGQELYTPKIDSWDIETL
ncbi:MAG: cell division protein FtsZ [Candidatus Altiarchaeota archaeon]